jgi:hypothetical protein
MPRTPLQHKTNSNKQDRRGCDQQDPHCEPRVACSNQQKQFELERIHSILRTEQAGRSSVDSFSKKPDDMLPKCNCEFQTN